MHLFLAARNYEGLLNVCLENRSLNTVHLKKGRAYVQLLVVPYFAGALEVDRAHPVGTPLADELLNPLEKAEAAGEDAESSQFAD